MLAFSPGHFIHSRMALSVLYPVPFVILWLIALRKVDEGGSDRWLFAGGAALGAAVYAYLAGVVMMPLYLVLTAALLAQRRRARSIVWAAAGFAIVLVPILLWSLAHPERYADLLRAYRPGEITTQSTVVDATNAIVPGDWRSRLSEWWLYFDPTYLFLSGDSSLTNSTRRAGLFPLALAVFLPFVALIATYGLARFWASPRPLWRIVGTALLLSVPIQFWGFYRDYMGPYREQSSTWYGSNLRGALVEVIQHPAASGQAYISQSIPYADVYWRFYSRALTGTVVAAPVSMAATSDLPRSAARGSVAVTTADEPLALTLDQQGWLRSMTVTEPTGAPSFVVFRKP